MDRKRKGILIITGSAVLLVAACLFVYNQWLAPTRILVINPLPAQKAELALSNDCRHIEVDFLPMEKAKNMAGYDAIALYGRSLFLDDDQMEELQRIASHKVPIFTNTLNHFNFIITNNVSPGQQDTLQQYFQNACQQNYRNLLRYLRHIATPHRWGDQDYEAPISLPYNVFYHLEHGRYFQTPEALAGYLKKKHLYHEGARNIAFIAGTSFPVESNRAHVDTLISRITQAGFNVYPIIGSGKGREQLIRRANPDAVVYLPMGRLGNDSFIEWLHQENIPLFMPFPLVQPHAEWVNEKIPVSGGTLTARIVIPEIDGGMAPLCIATQNENEAGYFLYMPEPERVDAFIEHLTRYMALRDKPNSEKRIAIGYFKTPGKDALLASGMEVAPSLYNFLKRLRSEGYNVSGLPATVEEFNRRIQQQGSVMGSYAKGAQEHFMQTAHPAWMATAQYEQWAHETLLPEKYKEVTDRYGDAPGHLLTRGDSLAVACLQFGNILLFPQPRPSLGEDEFKLVHGAEIAPPHSYLASYLYMKKGFQADALIHFGTHGNLEFTPGKNAGLSQADWADVLIGNLPHFYFYTTGNVGEAIIAKRRTHAVIVTYLTPPYVESGMRQCYATLLADIHKALDEGTGSHPMLGEDIKREVLQLGLHRELGLDSIPGKPYTKDELERIDAYAEEIANEKITGAYYTMGMPYSEQDLQTTVLAVAADPLAYETAKRDRETGKITTEQLQDYTYIAHHYLPKAKKQLASLLQNPPKDTTGMPQELRSALQYREKLIGSPSCEFNSMLRALDGGTVFPAPGGDPVLNPNVLPTGRNMYSINAETTPNPRAWEDGKRLAATTLKQYKEKHGDYPRKVCYTFWAGEFIASEGATLAQAFWMLGVEPVRDGQERVVDLRLIPETELGRPRINVVIQVSGQLRDIAASRLKLLTDAIQLASKAKDGIYPNYVAQGTLLQEKQLTEQGMSPKRAREMSIMRIFGPVNSGYSTGIMPYVENSGSWEKESEIAQGYLNNMGAVYGDDGNWGSYEKGLFASALTETDVVIQPRQSNTWGPVSLDHVYEFTGGLSLTVKALTGKEPDAYMADYRNRNNRRLQDAKEAIAVEVRSTLLNPTFIKERMKGGAGTAQMFGEIFRNVFGWNVTRPSAIDKELFNDLYKMYILDENKLGIHDYFMQVNPASYQAMTAVMLESARKGYWKPTEEQLKATASIHARITCEQGAACTEFVCGNAKLQSFVSNQLNGETRQNYESTMKSVRESGTGKEIVLKDKSFSPSDNAAKDVANKVLITAVAIALFAALIIIVKRRKK